MTDHGQPAHAASADGGAHFSCALTAVVIARVRRVAGDDALPELLRKAGSPHTIEYLADIANWVSYDEAIALLEAGVVVTGDASFARHVGEDTVKRLAGSSNSAVLRGLGSPEELLRRIPVAAQRFSVAAALEQLEAMTQRLESVFATAADLIASGDLDETLARIADRAGEQVRAPRHLLAVRPAPGAEVHCHHKGLTDDEAHAAVARIFGESGDHPDHWLMAPVQSHRNRYGWLVAMYQPGAEFFPQERQLLEVYARYAAAALDGATAVAEAKARPQEAHRRYEESRT